MCGMKNDAYEYILFALFANWVEEFHLHMHYVLVSEIYTVYDKY